MRNKTVPLLVLLGLGALAFFYFRAGDGSAADAGKIEGAEVRRGPLRISVVERGNLKAADSVELKSEVAGSTTILYLIEEGTEVHAGDLLCELDTSALVDRKVQQEIKVQNALATYTKAQQSYEIQVSQNTSDIARGKRDVEFAELDLRKYMEGEKPQELQKADEDILLRTEELQRAEQSLSWSEKLAEKGFLEQTQLDADRLAKSRAEVALAQAKRAKDLLVNYTIPRREKELQAAVEESRRELDRIGLQAKARLADYDANLKTSKAKYELEESELAKLLDQIEKAHMRAPVDGMVVYAMEERGRYGGGQPIQEGTTVRERQAIITIPSEKGFLAEASLHESVIEKVIPGMDCLVTVDALGTTVPGRVQFKAVLPDQQSWWANPDLRVYRTQVEILEPSPRMRPGMSCSIEILVDDLEDVIYIPVQSVFLDGGRPVALVARNGTVEKRPIEVGQNNERWVEVRSGLEEGETVLLSLPPGVTLSPSEEGRGSGPSEEHRPGGRPDAISHGAQRSIDHSEESASAARPHAAIEGGGEASSGSAGHRARPHSDGSSR
ncbi:MAG TPA: efflux transporter periplasmic adaptor subunit [Planctomycetes bacterium]|nr:efflux transporter periplasmic adaptor subunit [Planctomycetota bacterium]